MRETKEIECSEKCGVLTTINLPKTNYNRGKKFICGFCAVLDLKGKDDQIKNLQVSLQAEVAKLTTLFQEANTSLTKLNGSLKDVPRAMPTTDQTYTVSDRKLNVIVLGLKENENKDATRRTQQELKDIEAILHGISIDDTPESMISDYKRLGRFQGEQKIRPLLMTCTTIWNKRRIMSAFAQHRNNLCFRLKNDVPLTEKRKALLLKVKEKNEAEKERAATNGEEVKTSFSLRDDGVIAVYRRRNNRWMKDDTAQDDTSETDGEDTDGADDEDNQ